MNCLLLWPLCVLCVIYTCRDCGQKNCSVRMRANRHAHFPQSLVYVWRNRASRPPTSYSTSPPTLQSIRIATWNCRGLHNSIPYIHPTSDRKRHRYTGAARTLALAFRVGIQLFLLRSLRQSSFSHVHTHPWMWWMCYSMEEVYPCCCHVKSLIR